MLQAGNQNGILREGEEQMDKKLRKKFFNGKFSFGSWITFTSTASAEIMAKAGFNWLAIDMEHSPISIERAQELIQVIELSGTIPLVRLSSNDPVQIKRIMDAGAYGIIVPNVSSSEDVLAAIRATKYPPIGSVGGGLARAQGYGASFEDYKSKINANSIVIVQIENKDAVDNIEDILTVRGLNGVIIGPYDLSGSYGVTGQLKHPKVRAAEKRVLEAAKKLKIPAGTHIVFPDAKELRRRIELGYRLVAFGVDMIFLLKECQGAIGAIKAAGHRSGR